MHKLSINGIEVGVKAVQFEEAIAEFGKHYQVDDLEGCQTPTLHDQYDFDTLIEKATEYWNQVPLDIPLFCETLWSAATISVKTFFLKNFGILVKSNVTKAHLITLIYDGLPRDEAYKVIDAWATAKVIHSKDYDCIFREKNGPLGYLAAVKRMDSIIQQTDVKIVSEKLKSDQEITLNSVKKDVFKIGNHSFDFNYVAH
ncbi:hypothetical protein M3Y95_00048900 [Aphelenchoides besseyi]|nr:hypothetical protein M3Y95_00048900 [Aphelenchoides besseyi]